MELCKSNLIICQLYAVSVSTGKNSSPLSSFGTAELRGLLIGNGSDSCRCASALPARRERAPRLNSIVVWKLKGLSE